MTLRLFLSLVSLAISIITILITLDTMRRLK